MAPSFANMQPWRIVTVTEGEHLAAIKEALAPGNYWAQKAPAIAAFVTELDWDGRLDHGRDYAFFDLGQAAMNYQLQAVAEGLVAHPIAGFKCLSRKEDLGDPGQCSPRCSSDIGLPRGCVALESKTPRE